MRIVGGKYKGFRFKVPGQIKARPTTDFAKEALFNILNNNLDFDDLKVLDLFAGIGSISAEFISRGSEIVWAVEQDRKLVKHLLSLSDKLSEELPFKVVQADVFKFLNTCNVQFNLIFADPPYHHPKVKKLPDLIFSKEILHDGGIVIIEHDKSHDFSAHPNFQETRKYGNVHFTFFQKK